MILQYTPGQALHSRQRDVDAPFKASAGWSASRHASRPLTRVPRTTTAAAAAARRTSYVATMVACTRTTTSTPSTLWAGWTRWATRRPDDRPAIYSRRPTAQQLVPLSTLIPGWLTEEEALWSRTLRAALSLPAAETPVTIDFKCASGPGRGWGGVGGGGRLNSNPPTGA